MRCACVVPLFSQKMNRSHRTEGLGERSEREKGRKEDENGKAEHQADADLFFSTISFCVSSVSLLTFPTRSNNSLIYRQNFISLPRRHAFLSVFIHPVFYLFRRPFTSSGQYTHFFYAQKSPVLPIVRLRQLHTPRLSDPFNPPLRPSPQFLSQVVIYILMFL